MSEEMDRDLKELLFQAETYLNAAASGVNDAKIMLGRAKMLIREKQKREIDRKLDREALVERLVEHYASDPDWCRETAMDYFEKFSDEELRSESVAALDDEEEEDS